MLIKLRDVEWLPISFSALIVVSSLWALSALFPEHTPQYTAAYGTPNQEERNLLLGISPEGWTAIFTGFLTVSTIGLWYVTYAAATDTKNNLRIVERAYLFADFRKAFHTTDGIDLTLNLNFHNAGKTPAMAYEVYGEILDALPAVPRTYAAAERRMRIDVSVQTDALGLFGNTRNPQGGPAQGRAVIGYAKYRDVFGDDHITGFAMVFNAEVNQWETSGPGCEPWNYWD